MLGAAARQMLLQAAAFFGVVGFILLRYAQLLIEAAEGGLY